MPRNDVAPGQDRQHFHWRTQPGHGADATVNATGAVALGAASSVGTLTLQTTGNDADGERRPPRATSLTSTAGDISLTQGSNSPGGSVAAWGQRPGRWHGAAAGQRPPRALCRRPARWASRRPAARPWSWRRHAAVGRFARASPRAKAAPLTGATGVSGRDLTVNTGGNLTL